MLIPSDYALLSPSGCWSGGGRVDQNTPTYMDATPATKTSAEDTPSHMADQQYKKTTKLTKAEKEAMRQRVTQAIQKGETSSGDVSTFTQVTSTPYY